MEKMPPYTKPPNGGEPTPETDSPAHALVLRILKEQGVKRAKAFLGAIAPFLPDGEVWAIENRMGIKAERPSKPNEQRRATTSNQFNPMGFDPSANSQMQMMQMLMKMMNNKPGGR